MSLLFALPKIMEESKIEYENSKSAGFTLKEAFSEKLDPENILARGENLTFMKYLLHQRGLRGKIQLIYIDPPFFSQADYGVNLEFSHGEQKTKLKGKAYSDTWEKGMEDYLKMLCVRFWGIKELLSEEGCLWVHLDWHGVHYVKILLDEIFGEKNFVNEVIWQYKSGGTSKRHFSRKHDTLLFYSKGPKYYFNGGLEKSYNRGLKPYRFKGVKEYKDEMGWHTLVNMKDVWQIDMVGRTAKERTGYATQKPEALLERIVESCTRPGDLCADFFAGSSTLAIVAAGMGRKWICCDKGNLAIIHSISRLSENKQDFHFYEEDAFNEAVHAQEDLQIGFYKEMVDSDHQLVEIELLDFKPEIIGKDQMSEKDRIKLDQLLHEDPFLLVEYWSVDYHYDGILHRPKDIFLKKNHSIERKSRNLIKDSGKISIRLLDSLGRSYHCVVNC